MKKELIDEVVKGLHTNERYTYLDADKESLDDAEKCEIANKMRQNIYWYRYEGFDYYFTLSILIEDFCDYISGMMSVEDTLAYISLSDYMEHFGVEEYKCNNKRVYK